jgi:sacsin
MNEPKFINSIYFSKVESTWLLSTYLSGQSNLSEELSKLSSSMCLLPQMTLAFRLSGSKVAGTVFCCLPLPHGSAEAATGLPVHVNAYFGLSDNRRALKWNEEDQTHDSSAR